MGKDSSKPPCHRSAGRDYAPPIMDDAPASAPTAQAWPAAGFFAPMPFYAAPRPILLAACGLIPLPYGGLTFPPGVAPKPCPAGLPPRRKALPVCETGSGTATETETESSSWTSSDDDSDSDDESESTPRAKTSKRQIIKHPGTHLPGGLPRGSSYLHTGQPCHIHIIDSASVSLSTLLSPKSKADRKFRFSRHVALDNANVAQLIAALGGAGSMAGVTQIWEWGQGCWKKGSRIQTGDERAARTLKEMGWSEAGCKGKANVWLFFERG